jgi:hypothetical protein
VHLGSITFAWVSDYAQFYLVDVEQPAIADIESLDHTAFDARHHVAPNGLVIYTADSLRQEIRVVLHDSPPPDSKTESMSERPWTHTLDTVATFPSRRVTIVSPSSAGTEAWRPHMAVPSERVNVRINWCEDESLRYELSRPHPDVIEIVIWPAVGH